VAGLTAALVIASCGGGGASSSVPAPSRTTGAAPAHGRAYHAFALDPGRGHAPRRAGVPILVFHVIGHPPPSAPYPGLWVPWRRFVGEMLALKAAGYDAVTLDRVWRAWHGGPRLPGHTVVVSFDDGYASQERRAGATLRALRWPGVLNLEFHDVGLAGGLRPAQVRDLLRHGWELDAHTLTHPDLTTVDAGRLDQEVAGSRRWLRHRFHVPVDFFAYPSGRYDARAEAAVRAAGFHGATTTNPGLARPGANPYALPRVRVDPSLTPSGLVALLRATSARPS
jgi:peptidoglycan/xylan/chitin deacetylase (PgdA/CDA1 family)